jgi:hypothetical protein
MSHTEKNGKIYKIIALTDNFDINDIYFGSTIEKRLSNRFAGHKCRYKRWIEGLEKSNRSSYYIFEKYGLENCKIVLIEEISFFHIDELRKKENEYIMNNKCCNKLKAYKEVIIKPKLIKYIPNYKKVKIENKKEYDAKYRLLKSDEINEQLKCECGGKYLKRHNSTHIKTKKHLKYINSPITL